MSALFFHIKLRHQLVRPLSAPSRLEGWVDYYSAYLQQLASSSARGLGANNYSMWLLRLTWLISSGSDAAKLLGKRLT
jgi:hypothetical protein